MQAPKMLYVWPWKDAASDHTRLARFDSDTNKFYQIDARYGDVVALPYNRKGKAGQKVKLESYTEKRLKLVLGLLNKNVPERLSHMKRFLHREERIAIMEGIRRQLAYEVPELEDLYMKQLIERVKSLNEELGPL